MSEELFDVVFFGILQAGKDKDTVMQNMAALFKTDASKLTPYFAGGRKVIKGRINAAAAEKYRAALENVGLSIKIEACAAADAEKPASTSTEKTEPNNETKIDTAGLTVADIGSDVLENPVAAPAQKIDDISDISMAEVGADVVENPVKIAPQQIDDIGDISIAEVGSDMLGHPTQVVPQKISDISDISLADAGADLIENPPPVKKATIPDTSELSLDDEKD
jgi:hypothetical protein